ncbi:DMT family transporter [Adlercreutzia agrestimuris]|uniref:DMT family transporter n=1 Tax=Adlercreutzia agrestimuris TaxID=2941324 RepID=UPI00203E80AF|nr:DMT family transporter [Adlercreutzia agrestimuris]
MGQLKYKLLIVAATIIWGLSFVFMKDAVDVLPPAWLIGIRFMATGLILAVVFRKRFAAALTKTYLMRGTIIGVLVFLAFWTQTIGLAYTTPGKNAFLTGTYCVLVPFAWWLFARRKPTRYNIIAAILCIVGIGFVSLQESAGDLTLGFGDAMTLVCSVFFALHIVYVSKFTDDCDALALTVYQFLVGGACGILLGACTETLPSVSALTPDFLWNMVYLVVFASCMALVFQNVGLAHVDPAPASLLLSLESVFGVVFSVLLYGEVLTFKLICGFALIFGAILISELLPIKMGNVSATMPIESDGA